MREKRKNAINKLKKKGNISTNEAQKAHEIDEQQEQKANAGNYAWKHKHCKGLIIKPGIQGLQKYSEEMEKKYLTILSISKRIL